MSSALALRFAAILTWLMAGLPTLVDQFGRGQAVRNFWPWLAVWLAFATLFWLQSAGRCDRMAGGRRAAVATLSATALLALWLRPTGFMPVLLVLVAAGMPHIVSLRVSMMWMAAQTFAACAILSASGWPLTQLLPVGGAYAGFQLFAILTAHLSISESAARAELAVANAELRAAADLLAAGSRATERLRISRDLHDLLGHHLTALSVNLEVASHLTDGRAKEHVEHARSLARLLLSDVRAVVSDLRDDQHIDLSAVLNRLVEPVPQPKVELRVDPSLRVDDPAVAQVIVHAVLEIVTNAMRHSGAATLRMAVDGANGAMEIRADDDGRGVDVVRAGNGLRGMRERAEAAGGSLELRSAPGEGFHVRLVLPMGARS